MGKKKGKKTGGRKVSGTTAEIAAKVKDTSKYRKLLACADSADEAVLDITRTIDSIFKTFDPKATAAPEAQFSLPPGSLRATAIPGVQVGRTPENLQQLFRRVESDVKLSGQSPSQGMLLRTIGETIEAAGGSAIASGPNSESLIEKIARIIANPTSGATIELEPAQIQPVIDRTDPLTIINSLYTELINTVGTSTDHKMTVTACSQLLRKIQDELSLTRVDPRLLQNVTFTTKAMNGTIKNLSAALRDEIEESKSKAGENEDLKARLAAAQSESLITESDNAEMKKMLEAKIRDLNKELKAAKKENSAAKDTEVETLRAKIATYEENTAAQRGLSAAKDAKLEDLSARLEASTRKESGKDAKIKSLRTELEAATKANEDKEGRLSSLRTEMGAAKRVGDEKDKKISSLEAELKAATEASAKKETKTKAISKETEPTEHEMQIDELKKANADLRVQLGKAAGNLAASIRHLRDQAASLTAAAYGDGERAKPPSASTAPEQVAAQVGNKANAGSKKGR